MVAHWGAVWEFLRTIWTSLFHRIPHSPLTKQTVVSLKPTITTNSHQMFLLYSGVKTLHQKPSQLLLTQTLCLSVEFISNIPFLYLSSFSYQTVFICTGKTETPEKMHNNWRQDASASGWFHLYIIHSLFLSLSLCLSTTLVKTLHCGGKLSEPSLFPWHLSLSNQRWRPDSSCSPGKSSEWWLQQSEVGRRETRQVRNTCYQNTEKTILSN